MDYVVLASM